MMKKLKAKEKRKFVFFMDNARFHKGSEMIKYYKSNEIKIIFNVPYESSFDSVELSFRYIKNILYKRVYTNIEKVINDVKDILESPKFNDSLLFQYKETLERYIYYHNNYSNENLNDQ
jgi:hypothetical protein